MRTPCDDVTQEGSQLVYRRVVNFLTKVLGWSSLIDAFGECRHEGLVWDKSFLVFFGAALLKDGFQFALLEALTQRQENVFQFSVHHGAVLGFVVKLQDLNEIFIGTGILVLLDLSEQGHEVIDLDDLFLPLFGASELSDGGQGGVKVKSTKAVANVVGIHGAIALKVIDGEGEFHPLNIASTEIRGHLLFLASSTPR